MPMYRDGRHGVGNPILASDLHCRSSSFPAAGGARCECLKQQVGGALDGDRFTGTQDEIALVAQAGHPDCALADGERESLAGAAALYPLNGAADHERRGLRIHRQVEPAARGCLAEEGGEVEVFGAHGTTNPRANWVVRESLSRTILFGVQSVVMTTVHRDCSWNCTLPILRRMWYPVCHESRSSSKSCGHR